MATFSPRREIRPLAGFVYPGGIKAADAERHVVFDGRRGCSVKKPRFFRRSWPISWPASCRPSGSAPWRCGEPLTHPGQRRTRIQSKSLTVFTLPLPLASMMKLGFLTHRSPFLPMEPSRQQAYLALIELLLLCPSGEQPAVLESHQDLLDAEFLAMCEQVALMLEEQDDQNSALWLRNLATQLGEVIAAEGSGGGAEQQETFLMQLLQTINDSQADPRVVYPFLRDNLPLLNAGVVEGLNQWLEGVLTGADREQQQGLAGVVFDFGSLLAQFPLGNPGVNKRIAIAAYANALRVYTEAELPQAWATTHNNLGIVYSDLAPFCANPAEQIEKAIAACANALRVRTEAELPQDYAMTNNNLGNAYRNLAPFCANPAEQIEKAIAAYANALRVYTEADLWQAWATTNNNLGNAYRDLAPFSANPAEQIEKAIAAYANALRVYTEADQQQDWAGTNNNLGNAYRDLAPFSANPAEQIEKAIAAYANALRVYTEAELPQDYAMTNNNLGAAYSDLAPFSANPADQIEKAIVAYANALRVYTEAELPQAWAMSNNNLGTGYSYLAPFSANSAEQIEKAIAAYANALRVRTEAELPQDYAMTNNNLGAAYSALAPFCANPAEQIEKAIAAYANALRVMDPAQRSTDCLRTARNLGNLGFRNKLPDVAIKGYLLGITAVENLRSVAIDPARKAEIVSQAIEVYANLVQVYVDQQRFDQALEVADRSKARNLVELLSTKDLYPKGEIAVDVIRRLDELRGSIARAERELNRGAMLSGSVLRPEAGLGGGQRSDDNLRQLKQDLDRLIQEEIIETDPSFSLSQKVQPLSIEALQATLPDEQTVLVSWYVAGPKLIAFILAKNSSEPFCHRYPEPTLNLLVQELNSYFSVYTSNRMAWISGLPEILNRLSSLLEIQALADAIAQLAPQADQLILVPHRFLHLLPLHCLPFCNPTTTLLDQFSRGVRFAPSMQVLDVVQKRPQTPLQSLFALQNPTEDLLYTDLEVAEIQALFAPRATVLQRQEATKTAMAQQSAVVANSACLHFSCHGYFNFLQPELSALILAGSTIKPAPLDADPNRYLAQRDGSALDLSQCLTLLDLFELDLRQARLVALSACETGLSEINSISDEFVGLSSGFLYAGCNSVIGTLWTVNDLSTGLLMGEFFRLLKQQEQAQRLTDVALALKQAQQWLRQLTCAEAVATLQRLVPSLDADVQETAKRSIRRSLSERYAADDRPYHHPFYWAAFCAVGQ
jgi:CHAT domain-containing protein